jgi:endoglucanase
MKNIDQQALDILSELAKAPSIPFHEYVVQAKIIDILSLNSIPFSLDNYGNIIAKIEADGEPLEPIAFVAHMDHPGFEVSSVTSSGILAKPLGGVPKCSMVQTLPMFGFTQSGEKFECVISPNQNDDQTVIVNGPSSLRVGSPLTFGLLDFEIIQDKINMRSLDDYAGCASIISTLINCKSQKLLRSIYGVFTRAEEVGLVGARIIARDKTLPIDTLIVSIETSSIIPGVHQGNGPVIRVGDATFTFDSDAENVLRNVALNINNGDYKFKFQRNLMSAGTCEASAFIANSYVTTGIALPLGNWHNATTYISDFQGGIDTENVSLTDYLDATKLLIETSISSFDLRNDKIKSDIKEVPVEYEKRLIQ